MLVPSAVFLVVVLQLCPSDEKMDLGDIWSTFGNCNVLAAYLRLPIVHQVTPVLVPHCIQYISNSFKRTRPDQFISLLLQLTDLK
jgi:hypothetical protein